MTMREELIKMKKEVKEIEEQEKSLAYLLLEDFKKFNKRMSTICILELVVIIGMFIGFLLYESQFDATTQTETTIVDSGNGTATYLENSNSGDINYGTNN